MKKKVWTLMLGALLLLGVPGVASAGWTVDSGKWRYVDAGVKRTGWLLDGKDWFYLDRAGVMKTGWMLDGGRWYYLGRSGAMKTGWVLDGGRWYYLDRSGAMKTGWMLDGGRWYYLSQSGAMKTGWVLDGGRWYYLSYSGAMRTGWLQERWMTYFLDQSGAMVTGWQELAGGRYYFDPRSGGMMRQNFVSGYYLMDDGRMSNAGSAAVVSVVEDLKKSINVGITKAELVEKVGTGYHDLVGIEGEKYWLYTLKVAGEGDFKAVKWSADDFGAEDLGTGAADVIMLVFWDKDGKAFRVSLDYFDAAHKFHHYYSGNFDYEYN
ncbi:N-acetylmuramoyl-L-alanine amidase family protein [Bacillus sp. S3]|uniref:N-acetylmuramoyl-L-alanine amidase family protein n=1 Tax=Bacillus sp. S3 TaxID=486398 RepID=UPI00118AD695|nr:N-acetylmuramoyl-L-alanine amidase family protein [Bacillus sp. S3]QCJ44793.1 N-acetylmuramoyl-L-alanine amidase family protein [Bacillus sp. S3]